jgi:hypothetical protein
MNTYTATYSCQDNKLRLYTIGRLSPEEYAKVKAAGFSWAPKQELFVAPAWSPQREDVLLELCDEIEDESMTTEERAAARSERFDQYAEHREKDAAQAEAAVHAITEGIPLGQPILVGHHSEKRARKDAERIENGIRRAVKNWETSAYWSQRAESAIRHATYLERPDVRARRIKGLEADLRKMIRNKEEAEKSLRFWRGEFKMKDGSPFVLTREVALQFCNYYENLYFAFPLKDYPRNPPASQYEGEMGLWSALGGSDGPEYAIITPEQARELAIPSHEKTKTWAERWISHLNNRLIYEKAMLAAGADPNEVKPEKGGACHCWASQYRYDNGYSIIQKVNKVTVTVLDNWGNGGKDFTRNIPFDKLSKLMSAAQVQEARESGNLIGETERGFILKGGV